VKVDVAVVGGGPVGLAAALECRARGLSVAVFERRPGADVDKACGEGLMPRAVRFLERHGAFRRLSPLDCSPFSGIRYVSDDGVVAEGLLPGSGGLGVRRLALRRALWDSAREAGVQLYEGCTVERFSAAPGAVTLETDAGAVEARLLVGADGLHSRVRTGAGLVVKVKEAAPRYGLRAHFAYAPWTDKVEVHFAAGAEAYVTPVGTQRVGLAFLFSKEGSEATRFESLLSRFPSLAERLTHAPRDSEVMGAGPLRQQVSAVVADRVALVGDAAGYVDAVTGEGLMLGFEGAEALGRHVVTALREESTAASLQGYARDFRHAFRRYAWLTEGLLGIAARPRLRRAVLRGLAFSPGTFDAALAVAVGG
jgi:2-polyprenyl-6-methoxyphenol hydroxylase-like FAD-dependent oxidoreductase